MPLRLFLTVRLAALCAALAAAFAAAPVASAQPPARELRALTIAVEDAAGPWSNPDGTGFANDVVRAAYAAAGVAVRLDVVPYARCKRMVVDGLVPACFSMSPEAGLDTAVVFSRRAIFAFNTALVVARDGALRDARGLPHGATVGAVLGYEYSERFNRLARTGAIRLEFAGSEEVNVRKVVAGRLDAATVNVNAAKSVEYVARRAGVPGRLRALTVVEGLPAYIGFSRTHPDGARAMAAYEDGMSRIASNGTLARIDREWRRRDRAAAP